MAFYAAGSVDHMFMAGNTEEWTSERKCKM